MAISINQISSGMGLVVDGVVYMVIDYSHVKPGKGSAFVRVKLRDLRNDAVIERTFKTADKLEDAMLEERKMQFLYRAGENFHFMCQETYEEVLVSESTLGDVIKYLQENVDVTGIFYNGQVQKVILPIFIITEIIEAEPGLKGDSSKAGTKPVTIDTGTIVQAPLFIIKGDKIKLDTRSGQYVERIKR